MSDAAAYLLQIALPGEVTEEGTVKRVRQDYKFSMDAMKVIDNILEKSKAKGMFKEYQTRDDYNPYHEDEFEEAVIKKLYEDD